MKEFIEKLIGRFLAECVIYAENYEKALDMANQLAEEYNNDFCEWFKYDYRTIAPKNHDAENPYWRIPENWDKLKFCPYCGKKIKVVE